MKASAELSDDDVAMVSEVVEEDTQFGTRRKVKLRDKLRALELLGRHLGLFKEKVELTGKHGASHRQMVAFVSSVSARRINAKRGNMNKQSHLTDEAGEVRELTADDLRKFKPADQVLAPDLYAGLLEMNRRAGVRGPQKAPTKKAATPVKKAAAKKVKKQD